MSERCQKRRGMRDYGEDLGPCDDEGRLCEDCDDALLEQWKREFGMPTKQAQDVIARHCGENVVLEDGCCPFCGQECMSASDQRAAQIDAAKDRRKYGE